MAFKFNLKLKNEMKIVKKENKINIGYFNQHNNLDGVCFKFNVNEK